MTDSKWSSNDGSFKRQSSSFRQWIKKTGPHQPEANRYLLYVSLACPWAHRCLIVRKLKGLEDIISIAVVHWLLDDRGWKFLEDGAEFSDVTKDPIYNARFLKEVYLASDPEYSMRCTVPVLFDCKLKKIVSNESADIIRMLNSEFNSYSKYPKLDLYPVALREEIDSANEWIYNCFNNGVYRAGFSTSQDKYEEAALEVFNSLKRIEQILSENDYIVGSQLTEADVRLFTTAIRYDPVYFGHFKCNLLAIKDCPAVLRWMKRVYALVKDTVSMQHIKQHYYMSHKSINPNGIVPLSNGPDLE